MKLWLSGISVVRASLESEFPLGAKHFFPYQMAKKKKKKIEICGGITIFLFRTTDI